MSFCLQARDVKAMYSYADAKRRFEQIKPKRDGSRYLSRNTSLELKKFGDEYVCTYHHDKVVTYRPDNTIMLRSCGWETPSTARFVEACTGLRCFSTRGTLYVAVQCEQTRYTGHFAMDGAIIDMNTRHITNPTPQQRKVLDKARAKELRAPLMPFIRDITNMAKFMDQLGDEAAYRSQLPERAVKFAGMYVLREIARGMELASTGDAQAKELVTNWILWRAAIGMAAATLDSEARPVEYVRRVISKLTHQLYKDNDCVVWEDLPLGEIPRRSRY